MERDLVRRWGLAPILAVMASCISPAAEHEDLDEPRADVGRDVFQRSVLVEALDGEGRVIRWGSGTKAHLIYVATAAHVVEGARAVRYWTYSHDLIADHWGYVPIMADLVALDRAADIAFLRMRHREADLEAGWTPMPEESRSPRASWCSSTTLRLERRVGSGRDVRSRRRP